MAAKVLSPATGSGIIYTDRRNFYPSPEKTWELYKDVFPFASFVEKASIKGAEIGDPDFKMFEHRSAFKNQRMVVNNGAGYSWTSAGAPGDYITSVAIDGITGLASSADSSYEGLLCQVWDTTGTTYKGNVKIDSAASATAVKLIAWGNPQATANYNCAALVDNDILIVYGNAKGEGTVSAAAWADEIQVAYNSSQIFSTSLELTGTLYKNTKLRGYSSELARLRVEKMKEFKAQKNGSYLNGTRYAGIGITKADGSAVGGTDAFGTHGTDKNSNVVRTTMGVIPALQRYGISDPASDFQNVFNINKATYGWNDLVNDTEKMAQIMPSYGRLTAFAGLGAISFWSQVSQGGFIGNSADKPTIYLNEKSDMLGVAIKLLVTPHCEIELIPERSLRNFQNNTMVIVNPEYVEQKTFRPMVVKANIKTDDGYDGYKEEIFEDSGLALGLIESHKLINIS